MEVAVDTGRMRENSKQKDDAALLRGYVVNWRRNRRVGGGRSGGEDQRID
jgi:hypothetical protein